jgi:hypothetical protein
MRAGLCEIAGCGADKSVVRCSCGGAGGVGDYTRGEIALAHFGLLSLSLAVAGRRRLHQGHSPPSISTIDVTYCVHRSFVLGALSSHAR